MSDYTYPNSGFTFGQRDGLPPGSSEKVVKGIQLDAEYTALVTAVNSKLNIIDPEVDGVLSGTPGSSVDGGTF